MSDIYFKCGCGKSLAVDESGIGRTVLCVDCGKRVVVPEPEIEFDCEGCGSALLAPTSTQGSRIKCTLCGHRMTAPNESAGCVEEEGNKEKASDPKRCMDALMHRRLEFQARRRPEPEPVRVSGRVFRVAMLAVAILAGTELVRVLVRTGGTKDAREIVSERQADEQFSEYETAWIKKMRDQYPVMTQETCPAISDTDATPLSVTVMEPEEDKPVEEDHLAAETVEPLPRRSEDVEKSSYDKNDALELAHEGSIFNENADAARNAGLMSELHAVDELRRGGKREEFLAALESWRNRINEFTRTHSGKALDHIEWGIPFQTCYEWSNEHLCGSYEEAERLVREAIGILMACAPDDERLAPKTSLYLTVKHGHRWVQVAPGRCAALLDEIEEMAPWSDDPDLHRYWSFLVPILESNFLCYADRLPDGEREEFYAQRERKLLMYLRDERIPLEWRTRYAWCRSGRLERIGEMKKSAALLESFWREHGGEIEGAEFYNLHLWVTLFGEGDWEKASGILSKATSLSRKWDKPFFARQFKEMTETYYRYISLPGYELQRQKTILTARERTLK